MVNWWPQSWPICWLLGSDSTLVDWGWPVGTIKNQQQNQQLLAPGETVLQGHKPTKVSAWPVFWWSTKAKPSAFDARQSHWAKATEGVEIDGNRIPWWVWDGILMKWPPRRFFTKDFPETCYWGARSWIHRFCGALRVLCFVDQQSSVGDRNIYNIINYSRVLLIFLLSVCCRHLPCLLPITASLWWSVVPGLQLQTDRSCCCSYWRWR